MVHAGSGHPERGINLLWDREKQASRGPRARSSKAEIVEAAMAIADLDGFSGLSMRKLADRLGLTPMSLYPHVGTKSDLLDLMLDRAIGELVDREDHAGEHWRDGLERHAERAWQMYLRHPWVLDVASGRSALGPAEFTYFEQQLSLLDGLALPHTTAMQIIGTVGSYVRGSAQAASELRRAADQTGVPDAEYWRLRAAALSEIMDDATRRRFPRLAAAGMLDAFLEAHIVPLPSADPTATAETGFTFGLDRLLDGVETYAAGHAQAPPPDGVAELPCTSRPPPRTADGR